MHKSYYYHFNGHGDTIALTDNNGKVAQTYKYGIWGNLLESSGSIENPFTYGGQWGYIYDSESSLYFLKTRYYDASIGRFTSRDRFAGFENDSDSQNRYVYCQNDPVGNVDPFGFFNWNFFRSRKFIAGILNFTISILISGAVGGLSAYFKKQAKKIGERILKETLKRRLKIQLKKTAIKAAYTASILTAFGKLLDLMNNILDPGGFIFDLIDARDKCPHNGLLDFWVKDSK